MSTRLVIESAFCHEEDFVATVDRRRAAPFCLSIAQEKAMDSYNETFTCSISMTDEQARILRDWLIENMETS